MTQAPGEEPTSARGRRWGARALAMLAGTLVTAGVLSIRMWDDLLQLAGGHPRLELMVHLGADWAHQMAQPPTLVFGALLILGSYGLAGASSFVGSRRDPKRSAVPLPSPPNLSVRTLMALLTSPVVAVLLFSGAAAISWNPGRVAPLWLTLIGVVSWLLWRRDRRVNVALTLRLTRWEAIGLAIGCAAAFGLYAGMACSWRFSFVGDEFAFFEYAHGLVRDGFLSIDWLDGMGVYGDNPRPMSVYQGAWIAVLGPSCLAWRLAAAFLTVICLPPLYLALRGLVQRSGGPARAAAALGCLIFFVSEQIMVWAVQGKIHIAALPPVAFSLCLVLAARARGSALLYLGAGAACGSAFHLSLLGAAVSVPCVGLVLAVDILERLVRDRRVSLQILTPPLLVLVGLLLIAAPYLLQLDDLRAAADSKMVHYEGSDGLMARARGTVIGLLQPLWFDASSHFLWGNVVNPISAVLVCIAFFPGAYHRSRSLLIAAGLLVVCAVMTAGLSQYVHPSITRTFLIMVPTAVLASLGIAKIVPRRRGVLWIVALLLLAVPLLSWIKLWHFNPYQKLHDWHILAIYEIEHTTPDQPIAIVFPHPDPRSWLLETMITLHSYDSRVLLISNSPSGLNRLEQHLRTGNVAKVLHRPPPEQCAALYRLCAELGRDPHWIERDTIKPPDRGPLLEAAVEVISVVEAKRPEHRHDSGP